MPNKKKIISGFCFLLLCLICFNHSNARVIVKGLENNSEIASYIQEKIVEKYNADADKIIRSANVKYDLETALKAKGYYDAVVSYDYNKDYEFNINTGEVYTIEEISVIGIDDFSVSSLKQGDVLDAGSVLATQKELFNQITNQYCIYNLSVKHEIILDRISNTAVIRFLIEGGRGAKFGKTDFTGAKTIKQKYLSRFLKYKEGECWNPRKIEATKAALLETGLLSSAEIKLPANLPENKQVSLEIQLKERATRKIRLGAKYGLSEGIGVNAQWIHRNYFGSGENLSVSTQISTLLQSLSMDFTKPFFMSDKQSLNISSKIEQKDTDAFEELNFNIKSSIRYKFSPQWTGNFGVGFEASQITDSDANQENFGLISFPAHFNFDNRDNSLDPHKGHSLAFGSEFFMDSFGKSDPFVKSRITATSYWNLSDYIQYDSVLALRMSMGSILGSNTESLPATKRFYAGGGGSIRGFGFQEAGPMNSDGDPIGGRSLVEATAELRSKFTDKIGGVAFVDGGGVYDSVFPDFKDGAYIGAGIGARYYTNFGPIRFDVAVPVNKRNNSEQGVQIYMSIGQAF